MKQQQVRELLQRYREDSCTAEEKIVVEHWIEQELNESTWEKETEDKVLFGQVIKSKIDQTIKRSGNIVLFQRISVAAAILLTVSIGAWSYFTNAGSQSFYANDVAPGRNTATLTLANGHKIILSNVIKGKVLAREAGVNITKTTDGQVVYSVNPVQGARTSDKVQIQKQSLNTLSTARGEQYQVILPDQSKVWLNAASSIKFPATFAGLKTRSIELSGEAYFEVAKDKTHPFIVKTARQEIQVLGTHFNINSYADEESTTTTLIEGSVQVDDNTVIKPGQQAISSRGKLTVEPANIESALDWHRGDFVFNDDDFKATMRKIARWYDVDVIFEPSAPEVLLPGGWVSRSKHLSAVLNIMELTGKVHFKVEGRRITVTK